MRMSAGAKWYIVYTQPHAEVKAAAHLERQGFATYLPNYLKRRRHARRVDTVASPLFPRYLFVSVDIAAQRWLSIRSTVGVVCLLCSDGGAPTAVPDEVIEMVRREENELGYVKLPAQPKFATGDKVRIVDGVLFSRLGLFEGATDEQRVSVLLEFLGRKVRVVVDSESVAAA